MPRYYKSCLCASGRIYVGDLVRYYLISDYYSDVKKMIVERIYRVGSSIFCCVKIEYLNGNFAYEPFPASVLSKDLSF